MPEAAVNAQCCSGRCENRQACALWGWQVDQEHVSLSYDSSRLLARDESSTADGGREGGVKENAETIYTCAFCLSILSRDAGHCVKMWWVKAALCESREMKCCE